MEEEMMVSPAFIKKTSGVRGEEDEETGDLQALDNFFETKFPLFRKPNIFILEQCRLKRIWGKGARI